MLLIRVPMNQKQVLYVKTLFTAYSDVGYH